ncbi:hypothetical protein GCK72_003403 [Caenorhabditis remanei]|uniref:Uncharacterized protein n=1 Tax=Caenorhabditis remanei TaxID=31234 RepID=A0A6A5HX67_CAERE|nr:hypothetical protein GCK72_003403 [Caenorhabditis remanei]KAF1771576.1 hypothetical protein GCK72_003403 [Caenorhabditis remanei]
MFFYMLLSPYLCVFGLCDVYYYNYLKLDNLGCSELQKSLVKWMINNFFVMLFFLHKFQPRHVFTHRNMLRQGSIGVALTTVWIPVVKDSAHLLIPLMLIHAFCLVIGPFHIIFHFFRGGFRQMNHVAHFMMSNLFAQWFGNRIFDRLAQKPSDPKTSLEFVYTECSMAMILFVATMLADYIDLLIEEARLEEEMERN